MSSEALAPGTKLPLIYTFHDTVNGKGFVANVTSRGRALLLVDEDGEFWLHAVHPSGWADTGSTIGEAYAVFRNSWMAILYDVASEAEDFATFREAVNAFHRASESLHVSWKDAVEAICNRDEWAERLNLRLESSAVMPMLRVEEVKPQEASPALNKLDSPMPVVAVKPAA